MITTTLKVLRQHTTVAGVRYVDVWCQEEMSFPSQLSERKSMQPTKEVSNHWQLRRCNCRSSLADTCTYRLQGVALRSWQLFTRYSAGTSLNEVAAYAQHVHIDTVLGVGSDILFL